MKKKISGEDRSNFSAGVTSGFGAMKRRSIFVILGLLIGLVCGFKWANYNYRHAQTTASNALVAQAAQRASSGAAAAGAQATGQAPGQAPGQISDTIKKAKDNPNDYDAQRQAAELFMQIRRPEGALPYLQQANKLKPEEGEVMSELAGAYFFAGNYPDAISWGRKAIRKSPESRSAKFYLASSLILSKQNLDEAEKLLNQVEGDSTEAPNDAKDVLKQMRLRLQEARTGKPSDAKTSLQHGAESGGQK